MIHELKIWPEFFEAVIRHQKTHELRRNDRGYAVGDRLVLREYDPLNMEYSGRVVHAEVTYITSAVNPCALSRDGLSPDFAILSIQLRQPQSERGDL